MRIAELLKEGAFKLQSVADVPTLEAEILLAFILRVSRVYLHTRYDENIDPIQETQYQEIILRRAIGEPIAYLVGHREFWSLDLQITPDVLIPREETERLVELTLDNIKEKNATVADLGTGSGAIALALAKERPTWTIYAIDKNPAALVLAELNAKLLSLKNIMFCKGDWCQGLPQRKFDAIVSNPPYIAEDDTHLSQGDLRFEPRSALISKMNGLDDLRQIGEQAKYFLKKEGLLLVEHGFSQAQEVVKIFKKEGYTEINTYKDYAGCDRVTIASWPGFEID